jgi:hypothetical protein
MCLVIFQAHVFHAGTAGCAAFLANYHVQSSATVIFNNKHYDLPPWSISILPDCRTSIFNTAEVRIFCRTCYAMLIKRAGIYFLSSLVLCINEVFDWIICLLEGGSSKFSGKNASYRV